MPVSLLIILLISRGYYRDGFDYSGSDGGVYVACYYYRLVLHPPVGPLRGDYPQVLRLRREIAPALVAFAGGLVLVVDLRLLRGQQQAAALAG